MSRSTRGPRSSCATSRSGAGSCEVIADFLESARIDERAFERVFAAGGGPPAVIGRDARGPAHGPGDHPPCARAGHPRRDDRRSDNASSTTSSRTSRTSSTSDPAPPTAGRRSARPASARRGHPARPPVPVAPRRARHRPRSALAARGDQATVARCSGSRCSSLQFPIGALNDLADARRDAGAKPASRSRPGSSPPGGAPRRGRLRRPSGWSSPASIGPASARPGRARRSALGFAYDLRLKGTPISWLPFALGIPLLPLFAWLGATGAVPGAILVAAPLAAAGRCGARARQRAARSRAGRREPGCGRRRRRSVGDAPGRSMPRCRRLWRRCRPRPVSSTAAADLWPALLAVARRARRRRAPQRRRPSVGRRQRGWEVQAVALGCSLAAGWPASWRLRRTALREPRPRRRPAAPRPRPRPGESLLARFAAADHRDGVLEAELGDRQVLGEVRPVDRRRWTP